jgi:putative ABC transport system substrate-binding protein
MRSPTSLHESRAYSPENFWSPVQKDFCNNIGTMLARAYATACPRETRSAPAWPRVWRDRAATSPACQTSRPILPASDTNSCARLSQSPPVGDHGQYRQSHRRARFAKELVALQPDLILSQGTPTTTALLRQTRTIPIVFATVGDPIGSGFVASFPRPGGNVTGFNVSEPTMAGKWLELLKEIAPRVTRVAMLFNPVSAAAFADYWLTPFKAADPSFGVEAIAAPVRDRSELEPVIAAQAREPNSGLIAMPDSFTDAHRVEITSLATRYRLPAVYPFRFFAEVGGLLSYGFDQTDNFRRAATYVDRILKGAKPSELPVQAPVKFELVINLKAATALGLTVPPALLGLADKVIE